MQTWRSFAAPRFYIHYQVQRLSKFPNLKLYRRLRNTSYHAVNCFPAPRRSLATPTPHVIAVQISRMSNMSSVQGFLLGFDILQLLNFLQYLVKSNRYQETRNVTKTKLLLCFLQSEWLEMQMYRHLRYKESRERDSSSPLPCLSAWGYIMHHTSNSKHQGEWKVSARSNCTWVFKVPSRALPQSHKSLSQTLSKKNLNQMESLQSAWPHNLKWLEAVIKSTSPKMCIDSWALHHA